MMMPNEQNTPQPAARRPAFGQAFRFRDVLATVRRLAFDKDISDAAFRALLTGGAGRQKSDGREAQRLAAQLAKSDKVQGGFTTPEISREEIIRLDAAVRLLQAELRRLQHMIDVSRAIGERKGQRRAEQFAATGISSIDKAFELLAELRAADPDRYERLRTALCGIDDVPR